MTDPIYERLLTETQAARLSSAPAAPAREDPMSLASIEADIRNSVENAVEWLKRATDQHLPALATVAQDVENDPIAQALESVFLGPPERQLVASLITRLGTAAAKVESAEGPAVTPETAEPGAPADVPQPASGQPVAAGAAT